MKNACVISSLALQFKAVAEKVNTLAMGALGVEQESPELAEVYQNLLLDEVEHVQILTLELTKAVTDEPIGETTNADEGGGSVFGSGELTDDESKPAIENPVSAEEE